MEFHEQPDWQRTVGQFVEIRLHGETLRTGTVEAVMPDNSILWIAAKVLPLVKWSNGQPVTVYLPDTRGMSGQILVG